MWKIQPQWFVRPGKQTNKQICILYTLRLSNKLSLLQLSSLLPGVGFYETDKQYFFYRCTVHVEDSLSITPTNALL